MATRYWNDDPAVGGANDGDWATTANWFTDLACTTAAGGLPASSDSVVLLRNGVSTNSGSAPTVVNLTTSTYCGISLTVTGLASFVGAGSLLGGNSTLTGNANFDAQNGNPWENGQLQYGSTVTGNVTFTNKARLEGTVGGNATFLNGAYVNGTGAVNGNATFSGTSYAAGGYFGGNVTFTASSFTDYPLRTPHWNVVGAITFSSATPVTFNIDYLFVGGPTGNDWPIPASGSFSAGAPTWNLAYAGCYSALPGNVNASASSFYWDISGNLALSNGQLLSGTVGGTATLTNNSFHYGGTINGAATYTNSKVSGPNPFGWGSGPAASNYGTATFTGSGAQAAWGNFYGNLTFDLPAAAATMKNNSLNYVDGPATITYLYGKGVNGSSILGVV